MGQRHQLFVIARADGRYRTLAVLHQQWSYGASAVRNCQFVMDVIRASASALRRDIRKAEKLDWQKEVEAFKREEMLSHEGELSTMFPFATTCLEVAAGDTYLEPISILPIQCDNNDGITVFDVTNPDQPSYAFVSLPDSEHPGNVKRMMPMNAIEYMEIYPQGHFGSDQRLQVSEMVQAVAALPLIDAETLHSTWPTLNFRGHDRHTPHGPGRESGSASLRTDSIGEKTMVQAILKGFDSDPNDVHWFEEAAQLSAFTTTLREMLFGEPSLLDKPSGLSLLKRTLEGETRVDLTPFSTLQPSQVLEILQDQKRGIILSLPSMPELTAQDLDKILNTGKLLELHMGETPRISLQVAVDAISGKPVQGFTHASLYRLPMELMYIRPNEWQARLPKYPNGEETGYPLSQVIFVRHVYDEGSSQPRLEGGEGLAWTKTVSAEEDKKFMWKTDTEPDLVPLTLQGSLLTLDWALKKLPEVVAKLALSGSHELKYWGFMSKLGKDIARKCLALQADNSVLPLPAELYNIYRQFGLSNMERPPDPSPLRQGQWTLLVLQELPEDETETRNTPQWKLRYSFVSLDKAGELICLPVHDFEKALLSNAIYRPDNAADRADLVGTFESRLRGDATVEDARVSTCSLAEAVEALRLVDMYRAEVVKNDERLRDIRLRWR